MAIPGYTAGASLYKKSERYQHEISVRAINDRATASFAFNCEGSACVCTGDADCNDMFSTNVCGGSAQCFGSPPHPVVCICSRR